MGLTPGRVASSICYLDDIYGMGTAGEPSKYGLYNKLQGQLKSSIPPGYRLIEYEPLWLGLRRAHSPVSGGGCVIHRSIYIICHPIYRR